MSTKEIETKHEEGPRWKIVPKCATYDEADQKRLELAMEEDLQVKVHWQGKANARYFAVKTRTDPTILTPTHTKKKKKKR